MGLRWAFNPVIAVFTRERRGIFGYRDTEDTQRRSHEDGGRDWRDVATGQRMVRTANNYQKLGEKLLEILP